ncbi:MAG: transcription-repair coupling factor [Bacteroidales bacterium]|nr:transcription-repair coupling factor [Bacteroidales bacterium]
MKSRIKKSKKIFCSGLYLSARWFVLSEVASEGFHLVILPDSESAEYCAADLYGMIEGDRVFFLPSSGSKMERSNYKSSLNVQRTAALEKIVNYDGKSLLIVVTYPDSLSENVPDLESAGKRNLKISEGQEISHAGIVKRLVEAGFEKVDFVSSPGQFAVRGSIIDIFSFSFNNPYRVSFWGNEVEKINIFDCNTQLSADRLESVEIVSEEMSSSGSESLFSFIPRDSVIWLDSSDTYRECGFFRQTEAFRNVFTDRPLSEENVSTINFSIAPQPVFNKNFELLSADIRQKAESSYKVFIYGEKQSQLDRLKAILIEENCPLPQFVCGHNIHSGFIDNEDRICCYTDHEIFDRFHRVSIRRSVEKSEQLTVNDLNAFNIGDYVVHIDHGVGIFGGLVRMRDDKGRFHEVVKLTYRDGDVVFVSVHSLHKISKFRSKDGEMPKINKLGSKSWEVLKTRAKSRVKDIAKELINLYAKRRSVQGYAFSADSYLQDELESSFMYEDTPDQEETTRAVKSDMEDKCPMDRLVCGDVGFGKTEIAVRAAFKAAVDGKQVAVLVPTTILALQHYETFKSRLKDFPCNIDYVSRLRSPKQLSDIKQRLAEGRIDVLIGTHKILGEGFNFKDLGLLIIDEEQKFGVAAKEKLRQMKHNVDTLTLTATPIPRTLQFSLLGARDLSIISTPPPNRIPVQTEIILFDRKEIRSIIDYELKRGGQIFFLHNRVEELPAIEEILHRLQPDMKICVAHGQMSPKDIEDRMLGFIKGDYDLLLSTTIIENGLDIPNANTIIINQAQNIGLSDLHQLRGRVGRSNRKAFCYLIVPPLASVTDEARKRLKAIEEFSDLGSGFNIAMQDLDIRGAGNLLGAEQSGFIMDMGYETYQKILAEAMEELGVETGVVHKSDNEKFVTDCTVETDQPAFIPDDYIDIPAEKIRIYKQMDSMTSDKETERFRNQTEDRFGRIPQEFDNLFQVLRIRNLGVLLGFEKIIIKNGMLICFFVSNRMSPYYKSETFGKVLQKITENEGLFTLKQSDSKLKTVSRGVDSLTKACEYIQKLR